MLIVDASCVAEVVLGGPHAARVRERLREDDDQAAPHVLDAEVFGVIRRQHLRGAVDRTTAHLAVADLASWPAERFGHRSLLTRAWDLRSAVRSWDALYVALAEALDAPLLTLDERLATATGLRCPVLVP